MMGMGALCRISCLVLVVVGGLAGGVWAVDAQPKATVVFLVRHAEKGTMPKNDPPLTEAGRSRAALLAKMLRSASVTAVYSSGFARTDQTAKPVADAVGVAMIRYDARNSRTLAKTLRREHAGGAVLVVGHSNTVPALLSALGVDRASQPVIADTEYDNLFIVTIRGEQVTLVRLRFGTTSGA